MSFFNPEAIRRIKEDLFYKGIPGTKLKGFSLKLYAELIFEEKIKTKWSSLNKQEKIILLRHRQLLIKKSLSPEELKEFIFLCEEIENKDLEDIFWPQEYDSFESFIINLAIEKELCDGSEEGNKNKTKTEKRVFNRGRNSIFS